MPRSPYRWDHAYHSRCPGDMALRPLEQDSDSPNHNDSLTERNSQRLCAATLVGRDSRGLTRLDR